MHLSIAVADGRPVVQFKEEKAIPDCWNVEIDYK